VIDMLNVSKVHHLGSTGRYEEFMEYICGAIRNLERSGADVGIIASNTPHMFLDEIQGKVNLPLVNVVEETCRIVKEKGIKKIGLLGTIFTMEHDFYKTPFIEVGSMFSFLIEEREYLQSIILDELAKEIFKEETIAKVYCISSQSTDPITSRHYLLR
jgi:aspartate racemase